MAGAASPSRPAVSLSVLVPALNEEEHLATTVTSLVRVLGRAGHGFEVVIVNDGSTDGTARVAEALARSDRRVRVLHNERNMGLGYSYLRAVREASRSHFAYVPGDNSWPEASIAEIVRHLGEADVITSYATNPEVRVGYRRLVSRLYTRVLNLLFGFGMRYYNGLTIYPREFLLAHPATTWGFGFQAQTLLNALDDGLTVIEIGVPIDESAASKSRALTLRNVVSVLKTVCATYWTLRLAPRRPRAGVHPA
jgi:glycosyltransferase involved in cell wall biosynthesis